MAEGALEARALGETAGAETGETEVAAREEMVEEGWAALAAAAAADREETAEEG